MGRGGDGSTRGNLEFDYAPTHSSGLIMVFAGSAPSVLWERSESLDFWVLPTRSELRVKTHVSERRGVGGLYSQVLRQEDPSICNS